MDLLQKKAYEFALRIVRLSEYLNNEKKEFILSKKILDSGTNIGCLLKKESKVRIDQTSFRNIQSQTRKLLRQTSFCDSYETQRRSPYLSRSPC